MRDPTDVRSPSIDSPPPWWARPGLELRKGRLAVAGRDAEDLARQLGTPRFAFDLVRILEQLEALRDALAGAGLAHRVRYAMKACREPDVLRYIRGLGEGGSPNAVGIDASSPHEVELALASGWLPEEISLTGSNLTDADLTSVLTEPIHINVDLLSQLRRVGRLFEGRRVGIRVNPRVSVIRDGGDLYSGDRPTKFGIYPEDLARALETARAHSLLINALHVHVGWAYRNEELLSFEHAVEQLARITQQLRAAGHAIEEVNVGGGLGVPYLEGEEALDLHRWAAILARHLGSLGVVVSVEPGEFLVKEAGVLLAEVVTVEERMGRTFAGLNVGWNAIGQRYVYGEPIVLAPCHARAPGSAEAVTFVGNVNDADDLFAIDYPFPPVEEGDVVAMLAVGAYNQSMANDHCLRMRATATYFDDRI